MNAMIMPGVTIGEGAIVAAGSVVAKLSRPTVSWAVTLPKR